MSVLVFAFSSVYEFAPNAEGWKHAGIIQGVSAWYQHGISIVSAWKISIIVSIIITFVVRIIVRMGVSQHEH